MQHCSHGKCSRHVKCMSVLDEVRSQMEQGRNQEMQRKITILSHGVWQLDSQRLQPSTSARPCSVKYL